MARFDSRHGQHRRTRSFRPAFDLVWLVVFAAAWGFFLLGSGRPLLSLPRIGDDTVLEAQPATIARQFAVCGPLRRDNCVIDGDTFILAGERIRIADIDTPETHPPR